MNMHNPAHPGDVIRKLCLEPLGLTVAEAAKALGVTRKTLSQIINRRAGVSVEMALRLAKAFATTPESWLAMQQQYDLALARQRVRLGKVRRLNAA
jgi:antitoxin HigA-1